MFLKNSFKSVYRSPIKSILLVVILAITAFVWELGISTWMDIDHFLDQCNELYVTLGRVEYLGESYSNEYIEDEDIKAIFDFDKITALNEEESVILAETSQEYFGQVTGYERTDMYSAVQDEVVLVITGAVLISEEKNIYQVRAKNSLFSDNDLFGKTILVSAGDLSLKSDKDYVLYAKNQPITKVLYNVEPVNYYLHNSNQVISGCYELAEDEEVPAEYYTIADSLVTKQNGIVINPTGNLESIFLFHQDQLFLEAGRSFSEEEYEHGEKVCIINGIMSDRLGVSIGDEIELSWINDGGTNLWADYWPGTGFSETEKFKIVGITNKLNEKNYYVYVPSSDLFHTEAIAGDHEILRVVLENQKSAEYVELINEQLGDDLKFSLYDQGYANTAGAYVSIKNIAKLIVFSVSILCLASIFLIGYGSVYRRGEIASIMMKFGCKRVQIIRYYSYSGMYLAIVGILFGTIVSLLARTNVFELVQEISKSRTQLDLRFSDFSYAMQRKAVEFEPMPGINHFLWMAIFLLFVCFIVVFVFSLKVSQIENKGERKIRRQTVVKIRRHRYGRSSFGFSIRQIMRSRFRTIGILFLGVAMTIFGGVILDAYHSSSSNLEELMTEEVIQGYCVDTRGKIDTSLLLSPLDFKTLYENENFDHLTASANEKVIYCGISKTKDGNVLEVNPEPLPKTEANQMLMNREFMNGINLYYTSSLDMSPRFIYQKEIKTMFLDGFDASFLTEEYVGIDELHAMVSFQMGEEEGIELGDSITILYDVRNWGHAGFQPVEFQVVGFYQKNVIEEDMYVPLDYLTETSFMREVDISDKRFFSYFDSANCLNAITFRLNGLENITEAKDALVELGFEEIETAGMNRKYVLLEDGVALSNLNNFIIQDQYTRALVILMVILSAVANIFISSSLIRNRKNDIGVMMGMGATKIQIYKAFVTEIVLVYIVGNLLGAGFLELFVLDLNNMHYFFFGGAALCFIVGATYSLLKTSDYHLIKNMKDVEE